MKGSEEMDMATAAEVIEKLARENEQLRLLVLAKSSKDLDELIQKLTAIVETK